MSEIPSVINRVMQAVTDVQLDIEIDLAATPGFPTSVRQAYPYQRWNYASQQCPFFANQLKGGPVSVLASRGDHEVASNCEMYLCLLPESQGELLESNEEYVLRWRDAVFAAFSGHLRLGGDIPELLVAHVTKWDWGVFDLGDTPYFALFFNLTIVETLPLEVGI